MRDCFFYFNIHHGTTSNGSTLICGQKMEEVWHKTVLYFLSPPLPSSLPPSLSLSYLLIMFKAQEIFTQMAPVLVLVMCKANLKQYLLTWPSPVRSCLAHPASCWQRSPCHAILNTYLQERLVIIICDTICDTEIETITSRAWKHQWAVWLRWNIY